MMKTKGSRVAAALLVAALSLLLVGCAGNNQQSGEPAKGEAMYHQLAQEEAKKRMDSGDPVVILDVRTQAEYDAGHIAGAVLLPNEKIGEEMPTELPDKNAEILIYCRSGNRSAQAARKLVEMGYTAVYDFGGINSWPYDLVAK